MGPKSPEGFDTFPNYLKIDRETLGPSELFAGILKTASKIA